MCGGGRRVMLGRFVLLKNRDSLYLGVLVGRVFVVMVL